MKRAGWVAGAAVVAGGAAGTAYLAPLAADPRGPKDCGTVLPDLPGATARPAAVPEPRWSQRGGTANDASCLSRTPVAGIVAVRSDADVGRALAYARAHGLTAAAAGVRHSMGGQALPKGGVLLDMRGFDRIVLHADRATVTVQAGATWHAIQQAIHPRFAVKAMQSTDIFTVGGSLSVNAHGMDHRAGAVMDSVRALRVMLADGRIVAASRTEHPDLFAHVIGGNGLFGVILEAELDLVDNAVYRSERALISYRDFPREWAKIEADPTIGLMYAHLSTAQKSLLDETLVYTYRRVEAPDVERAPLGEVSGTRLRRLTVNLAKRSDAMRDFKWWAEKNLEHKMETCTVTRAKAMAEGEACLVSRNDPMHDSVDYLRNDLPAETDILHEYFVPRARLVPFIDGMRAIFRASDANLVNASIRAVNAEHNALSYAPVPSFSVVLYLNQPTTPAGTAAMARLTSALIDLTAREGGRFFLPYQLHYTPAQLLRAYPEAPAFFAAKRRWDPADVFGNAWYARYGAVRRDVTQAAPASNAASPRT